MASLTWNDVEAKYADLFSFFRNANFFGSSYSGKKEGIILTSDKQQATQALCSSDPSNIESLQDLMDRLSTPNTFPHWLESKIEKEAFSCFDGKILLNGFEDVGPFPDFLLEVLQSLYIKLISERLVEPKEQIAPELWEKIDEVVLANGLPCGWKGNFPEGNLIVLGK